MMIYQRPENPNVNLDFQVFVVFYIIVVYKFMINLWITPNVN